MIAGLAGVIGAPLGGNQEPEDGFRGASEALEALRDPNPRLRQAAGDWLAARLRVDDFAAVAQAVQGGTVEVRARLAAVVGARDAHLGLAAQALVDVDDTVEAWGREALVQLLLRWDRAALDPPMPRRMTPESWTEELRSDLRLELRADTWLAALDRFDRLGRGPVPVVVDASLEAKLPSRAARVGGEVISGPWTAVLHVLTGAGGLGYVVQSWRQIGGEGLRSAAGTRPWVRVCRSIDGRGATTAQLVEDWIRGVQRELDPAGTVASARALARHGWPAALEWLERRWLERGDEAAMEGVLAAAARGRVVPSLAKRGTVESLWLRVDTALMQGDPGAEAFAARVARALAQAAATDLDGVALVDLHCTGVADAKAVSEAGRWARLVVLEGQGLGTPAARAFASGVLFGEAGPSLRLAALRALLACRDVRQVAQPRTLPRERDLFLHGARAGAGPELPAALAAVGAVPAQPGALGADAEVEPRAARMPRLAWHLLSSSDNGELGARLLAAEASNPSALVALSGVLRNLLAQGRGDALQATLDRLEKAQPELALRLQLRLGLASPEAQRRRLDEILAADRRGEAMWDDLALLTASRDLGWRARAQFLEAVEAGGPMELLQPRIEQALEALQERRMDEAARAFLVNLRRQAVQADHPLAAVLLGRDWPPPRRRLQRDLERLERRF